MSQIVLESAETRATIRLGLTIEEVKCLELATLAFSQCLAFVPFTAPRRHAKFLASLGSSRNQHEKLSTACRKRLGDLSLLLKSCLIAFAVALLSART